MNTALLLVSQSSASTTKLLHLLERTLSMTRIISQSPPTAVSPRTLSLMAMSKLSLALLFLNKYWYTVYDFGKEVWHGGIFLKAGDTEPSTTWAITAQKGETDYCHTVPQHLGYKLWVVCGGIIAIYRMHRILYQTLFSHFNQSSSAFSAILLNIKDVFKALAGSIG